MRVIRCFVPSALRAHSVVALPESAAIHIRRVLRLRAGAELTLFDGRGGEFAARLLDGHAQLRAELGEHRAVEREAPLPVMLLQSLARGERMDWIVQKATELGVTAIAPVASRFSVVQLSDSAAEQRLAHWRAVAISACEQCGRNRLPLINPPLALQEWLTTVDSASRWVLAPSVQGGPTAAQPAPPSVALLIGPEGGLSVAEIAQAEAAGFKPWQLGPRVLRTETAPVAALAALQLLYGDFR